MAPSVAALALFSTDFNGIEDAMSWIYDTEDDTSTQMRHPFVASLPNEKPFNSANNVEYLGEDDLESNIIPGSLVCYICGFEKHRHN